MKQNTMKPAKAVFSLCLILTSHLLMGFASPPAEAAPAWKTGKIVAQPSPANSGNVSGGGSYRVGSVITLGAHPFSNWVFIQWQDGVTTSNRTIVVPRGTTVYTATFRTNPPTQYGTVHLAAEPINGGSVSGSGTYVVGQSITISAAAAANFTFTRWQDGDVNASRPITVPPGSVLYTATFSTNLPVYGTIGTSAEPVQGGSVNGGGTYPANMSVTLVAIPNPSWRFLHWQDGLSNATRTVAVPSNNTAFYTAFFQNYGTIMLTSEPPAAGTVSGAGTYPVGTLVTLSALPSSTNWLFARWQDGNTNTQRQVTVSSGTVQMTATFVTNAVVSPHASLYWNPSPVTNVDYLVSYGVLPHTYTNTLSSPIPSITVSNLTTSDTYYWSVRARDSKGLLSQYSCEVWWKYPGSNSCSGLAL